MKHQKVYDAIIEKAKSENRKRLRKNQEGYVYYEEHHIIPRCLNGSEEKENKVLLTAREHYVCHKLLTYIYKDNINIMLAFHLMIHDKRDKKERTNMHISSRDYAYLKELFNNNMSGENHPLFGSHINKGRKLTEEHKQKLRGPKSEEHKQHMRHPKSEQGRKNMKGSNKGKKPWNAGLNGKGICKAWNKGIKQKDYIKNDKC